MSRTEPELETIQSLFLGVAHEFLKESKTKEEGKADANLSRQRRVIKQMLGDMTKAVMTAARTHVNIDDGRGSVLEPLDEAMAATVQRQREQLRASVTELLQLRRDAPATVAATTARSIADAGASIDACVAVVPKLPTAPATPAVPPAEMQRLLQVNGAIETAVAELAQKLPTYVEATTNLVAFYDAKPEAASASESKGPSTVHDALVGESPATKSKRKRNDAKSAATPATSRSTRVTRSSTKKSRTK